MPKKNSQEKPGCFLVIFFTFAGIVIWRVAGAVFGFSVWCPVDLVIMGYFGAFQKIVLCFHADRLLYAGLFGVPAFIRACRQF
jgi:hypothetical protein